MKLAYIIRGLPGSGKSTLAGKLSYMVVSADDYFITKSGEYQFDPIKLPEAHQWCFDSWRFWIDVNKPCIAVANTFSQVWEWYHYHSYAYVMGYEVKVIDLFDNGLTNEQLAQRNTHGVPISTIANMRKRWQF